MTLPKIISNFSTTKEQAKNKLPVYEMSSAGDFPIENTLLPLFKRKLISYVNQKKSINKYFENKENLKS